MVTAGANVTAVDEGEPIASVPPNRQGLFAITNANVLAVLGHCAGDNGSLLGGLGFVQVRRCLLLGLVPILVHFVIRLPAVLIIIFDLFLRLLFSLIFDFWLELAVINLSLSPLRITKTTENSATMKV